MQNSQARHARQVIKVVAAGLVVFIFAVAEGSGRGYRRPPAPKGDAGRIRVTPVPDMAPKEGPPSIERGGLAPAAGEIAIPDRKGMKGIAERVARELWGAQAQVFDEQAQLGPGGRPGSYLYIFTLDGAVETKEEILARLAAGTDPIEWDERIRCLEMGAAMDVPPVKCHWAGLPPEYLELHRAQARLREEFGARPFELVRRHGSAAFPVLEFQSGEEGFFYQPSTGRAGRGFELRPQEPSEGGPRRERNRVANRSSWERLLARLGH